MTGEGQGLLWEKEILRIFIMVVVTWVYTLVKMLRTVHFFFFFWLHQVLVVARGTSVEACVIFFVAVHGLFIAARGLLSSCGLRVFSPLVVACGLQSMWARRLLS